MSLLALQAEAGAPSASEGALRLALLLLAGGLPAAALGILVLRGFVPAAPRREPGWGFLQVLGVVGLFVALQVAVLLALTVAGLESDSILLPLGAMAAATTLTGAATVLVARLGGGEGWRALGFRRGGAGRACLVAAATYLLCFPALFGVAALWPWVLERLGREVQAQEVLLGLIELQGPELAAGLLLGALVVPFLEELLFRGFLQPVLVRALGGAGGVVATSLVFAALHGTDAFVGVFALSLLIGGVMLRTQRLLAAWTVHALHNGGTLALVLFASGMRDLLPPEAGWLALLPS